jgi:hypothetical protein
MKLRLYEQYHLCKKGPMLCKEEKMLMIRQLKTIPIGVKFIKTKFCKSIHAFLKEAKC